MILPPLVSVWGCLFTIAYKFPFWFTVCIMFFFFWLVPSPSLPYTFLLSISFHSSIHSFFGWLVHFQNIDGSMEAQNVERCNSAMWKLDAEKGEAERLPICECMAPHQRTNYAVWSWCVCFFFYGFYLCFAFFHSVPFYFITAVVACGSSTTLYHSYLYLFKTRLLPVNIMVAQWCTGNGGCAGDDAGKSQIWMLMTFTFSSLSLGFFLCTVRLAVDTRWARVRLSASATPYININKIAFPMANCECHFWPFVFPLLDFSLIFRKFLKMFYTIVTKLTLKLHCPCINCSANVTKIN